MEVLPQDGMAATSLLAPALDGSLTQLPACGSLRSPQQQHHLPGRVRRSGLCRRCGDRLALTPCPWRGTEKRLSEEVGKLAGALKNYLVSRYCKSRGQQQHQGLFPALG